MYMYVHVVLYTIYILHIHVHVVLDTTCILHIAHTCACIYCTYCTYMEIHVHSTLALRNQKEKKVEVTHPAIAQTNKHNYNIIAISNNYFWGGGGGGGGLVPNC